MHPPDIVDDEKFIEKLGTRFRDGDSEIDSKAQEARNVDFVKKMFQLVAGGNFTEFSELLADNVEYQWFGPEWHPFAGTEHGRKEVTARVRQNFNMLREQRPQLHAVVAQGDMVSLFAEETGQIRSDGRPYRVNFVQLFCIRDGKLESFSSYDDGGLFPPSSRAAEG